jgi:hypothetical protein
VSRSWAGGSTAHWRRLRRAVLFANVQEHGGRCQLALPRVCTGTADQVHHMKGKAFGDNPRDLLAVCRACNLKVGNPTRTSPAPRPTSRW